MFRRAAPAAAEPAAAAPAEPAAADLGYAPRVAIVALADLLPREGVGSEAFYVAVRGASRCALDARLRAHACA